MKKFAVFGNPIEQSLSPTIHQMFADQVGEKISYEKILAPEDSFIEVAKAFLAQEGAVGCNVTMPFKLDAFNLAKVDDQAAKDAQAVNTLMNSDTDELLGFNTDGVGLVNDLLNSGVEIKDKRVLLIGAGGAARGVISPLLNAGAASLTIANRTRTKAEEVANAASNPKVQVVTLEDIATIAPHIIINSTAASLSNELPCSLDDGVLQNCEVVYDMVYKNSPTRFMRDAAGLGVKTQIDGLGMLVEQAAEAFYIWTRKRPDTSDIVKRVRDIVEQGDKRN
ncbi:shikimate dehydrogenase [Alteromonas sp. BMJM2]|uniref:shikimate dehydrogenase n=1 Tax=Alteromonas sp. BMJM2 TaxID=2954241 RepID=UPI0022B4D0DD|nr:shikimate dehydrogenase [Alteromonas sp. BMJM2]